MTKRVLIVHENSGSGHRRVAGIVAEAVRDCPEVQADVVAGSEFGGNPGGVEAVIDTWNFLLQRNWLKLNDAVLNFALRTGYMPIADAFAGDGLYRALDRYAPDALVCTADMYSKVLGRYAEQKGIPFSIWITDMSIFMDLVHPYATHVCIFEATANAVRSFDFESPYFSMAPVPGGSARDRLAYVVHMYRGYVLSRRWGGIYRSIGREHEERNQARCVSIGPMVTAEHFQRVDRDQARAELGVDRSAPCVALLSGSLGGSCLLDWTRALQRTWSGKLTVIAVCGRSERVRGELGAIAAANPEVRVLPLGFADNMPLVYGAVDAVIARPSAGVVSEALRHRRPLVLPSYAMSNDLGCLQLIRRSGAGEVFGGSDDLAGAVRGVVSRPEIYGEAIDRLLAPYPKTAMELTGRIRELVFARAEARRGRGGERAEAS